MTCNTQGVDLPVNPPILPMLAKRIDSIPSEGGWIFEPKWDGFRVIVFRDHEEVLLQSRDERPLNRYFPELISPLREALPMRCVLDGEIVVERNGALDFEALQMRIHPAASRVLSLSRQTPAAVVFFDMLALDGLDLREVEFAQRRGRLERALSSTTMSVRLTPATRERQVAEDWFRRFEGAGLDGIVAKPIDGRYQSNKRVMFKVKHGRECDCVVAGFRWHKSGPQSAIGSLLLGLYDEAGLLQHVGVCASFAERERHALLGMLTPYRRDALVAHPWRAWAEGSGADTAPGQRMPGGLSRWSQGKDLSWEPLRPELVVQVAYDHMQGTRFRHTAQFRRWRFDKPPAACTFAQLEVVAPEEIAAVFHRA